MISTVERFNKKVCEQISGELYHVGGYVRDSYLNEKSLDFDMELFNVQPEDFVNFLNENNIQFDVDHQSKFPVYRINFEGTEMEVGFPRTDNKVGDKHNDFDCVVNPHLSINEAAKRRDFTCNAIYKRVTDGVVFDSYNGVYDLLMDKKLNFVNPKTFIEDPLRFIRAFQLISRFGFDPSEELINLIRAHKSLVKNLSRDAIYHEIFKAFNKAKYIKKAMQFLIDTALLKEVFPMLEDLRYVRQSSIHHQEGDALTHSIMVADEIIKRISEDDDNHPKFVYVMAALFHDVGKLTTTQFNEQKRDYTSHGHEKVSYEVCNGAFNYMKIPSKYQKPILGLIKFHMSKNLNDKSLMKRAFEFKNYNLVWRDVLLLIICDNFGRISESQDKHTMDNYVTYERLLEMNIYWNNPDILITGKELIEMGCPSGVLIGQIIEEVKNKQIGNYRITKEEVIEFCQRRVKNIINK